MTRSTKTVRPFWPWILAGSLGFGLGLATVVFAARLRIHRDEPEEPVGFRLD